MSQEMETILRKSLDDVDRIQRRQVAGFVIFLLLFLLQAFTLFRAANRNPAGIIPAGGTVGLGISLMVFTVGFCTFGITFFISRMTKRILKAIELLSKP
jgi:hypothetical protein